MTLEEMVDILIRDKELVYKWVPLNKIEELHRILEELLTEEE